MIQVLEDKAKAAEEAAAGAEAQRRQAIKDAATYKAWATKQLADAKKKIEDATKLAQTTAVNAKAGTPADLQATVNAANAVAKVTVDLRAE